MSAAAASTTLALAVDVDGPHARAPAPEAAWLAAITSVELERLVGLPAARLAAVFADALAVHFGY